MAERFELEKYRRQSALLIQSSSSKEDPALLSCQICGDDNLAASAGLLCPQLVEESKHFLCDGCITSYVNSLNNDPADSFFHQREGKIPCPGKIITGIKIDIFRIVKVAVISFQT